MTKIKYLQDGWKEYESTLEDYVAGTLMQQESQGQLEQIEEKTDIIATAFGKLIKHLHDNNQLKLTDIEYILSTYEGLTYKEE